MNIKQQIDELRKFQLDLIKKLGIIHDMFHQQFGAENKIERELNNLINQLEKKLQEDLQPGDICEVWDKSIEDIRIVYFIGRDKFNNCRFSIHKRNIGKPSSGDCFENCKKLTKCNHKVIWSGWMATDKNGKTFCYSEKVKRKNDCFVMIADNGIYFHLGQNINNQTFDDEPIQVDIIIKE